MVYGNRLEQIVVTVVLGIVMSLMSACATGYKAQNFEDVEMIDGLSAIKFTGSPQTTYANASLFSAFRAIEKCLEQKHRMAVIYETEDQSPTHLQADTGMWGQGSLGVASTSTSQARTFPVAVTKYICRDIHYSAGIFLRTVSVEDMKLLLKDLKAGLRVDGFLDNSPNKNGSIVRGDIIYRINGTRVENTFEMGKELELAPDKSKIPITFFRDGETRQAFITIMDQSEAVMGNQKKILEAGCKNYFIEGRPLCKQLKLGPDKSNLPWYAK